jgi:hypothetical protein
MASPALAYRENISSPAGGPSSLLGSAIIPSVRTPIRSVWAPNLFTYPVVRQPDRDFTFVSTERNTLTQFGLATEYDNIGILAHNYLAGRDFFDLKVGKQVYIIHDGGHAEAFTVTSVLQYQALDPENPFSDFRDLNNNLVLSATEMFSRVYTGRYHVTFQTCIARSGDDSWGRLFVIAEPVSRRSK